MLFRAIGLILLLTFYGATVLPAGEKPNNYCQDPSSWERWNRLCDKYPADDGLQVLHALRIGLCVKVQQDEISLPRATRIFENARQRLIKRKAAAAEKDRDKQRL